MAASVAWIRVLLSVAAVTATGCVLLPLEDITEDAPSFPFDHEPVPSAKPTTPKPSATLPPRPPPPPTPSNLPPDCVPECGNAQCGDNGCGDVCGECDVSLEECVSGACLYQTGTFSPCTCDTTAASPGDVVIDPLCASGYAVLDLCVDAFGEYLVCSIDASGYPSYQWASICIDADAGG